MGFAKSCVLIPLFFLNMNKKNLLSAFLSALKPQNIIGVTFFKQTP
jgi:hypothetical protein